MYLYFWIATQIIIEMLPISSSGHLTVLELFLKKHASFDIKQYFDKSTLQSFYYFLHGPTLLIICGFFFAQWWQLLFTPQGIAWHLVFYVLIADLITFLIYLLFQKYKIQFSLGLGFLITTAALFSTAWCSCSKPLELFSFSDAIILGFAQGLALLPGISRLALSTSIACLLGFALPNAFLIAWTIAVPLMAAAFLKSLKDLHETRALRQVLNLRMALVMLSSSGISVAIMGILMRMVQNNSFYFFGFYMLVPLIVLVKICSGEKGDVRDTPKSSN